MKKCFIYVLLILMCTLSLHSQNEDQYVSGGQSDHQIQTGNSEHEHGYHHKGDDQHEEADQLQDDDSENTPIPLHKKIGTFGLKYWRQIAVATVLSAALITTLVLSNNKEDEVVPGPVQTPRPPHDTWLALCEKTKNLTKKEEVEPVINAIPKIDFESMVKVLTREDLDKHILIRDAIYKRIRKDEKKAYHEPHQPALHTDLEARSNEQALEKLKSAQKGSYILLFAQLSNDSQRYVLAHLMNEITKLTNVETDDTILGEIITEAPKPVYRDTIKNSIQELLVSIKKELPQLKKERNKKIKDKTDSIIALNVAEWWNAVKELARQDEDIALLVIQRMSRKPRVKWGKGSYFERMIKGKTADEVERDFPGIKDEFFKIKSEDKW